MPTTPDPLSAFLSGFGQSTKRVASEIKSWADATAALTNMGTASGGSSLLDLRDAFVDVGEAAHLLGATQHRDRALELATQADDASHGKLVTGEKVLQEAGEQLRDERKSGKGKGKKKPKAKRVPKGGRPGYLPRHAR